MLDELKGSVPKKEDDETCKKCPLYAGGKDERMCSINCPKCDANETVYVTRDRGNVGSCGTIEEVPIWRCMNCGHVFTVSNDIKCGENLEIETAIEAMSVLEDGWDGNNAKKILERTVERAMEVADRVQNCLLEENIDESITTFPGMDGSVVVSWRGIDFIMNVTIPEEASDVVGYFAWLMAFNLENRQGTNPISSSNHVLKGKDPIETFLGKLSSWIDAICDHE